MARVTAVFISAVSRELGSFRRAVRDKLLDLGVYPVLEEHFPPDYREVVEILRARILPCDAVICLAGHAYGQEPGDRPPEEPRRSYTQLEYDMAVELDKPVYVFLATEQCPVDAPSDQSDELRRRQQAHRRELQQRPELYSWFESKEELVDQIARIRFPAPSETRRPQNLPYATLGKLFKGREEPMRRLGKSLESAPSRAAVVVARHAVHGLGGIGKTRLAIEYAWENRSRYSALLFVTAPAPEDLQRNLASLCGPLVLNLEEQASPEQEIQAAAALRWLERNPGWLLILDNVDTEAAALEVEKVLPRLQRGHVLITSRLSSWGEGLDELRLDVLGPVVSGEFLLQRTAGRRRETDRDQADAAALAGELGGLALALEQAGSYVRRARCSLGEYLERWRRREKQVREWFDERQMKYDKSVAVTWETTFQQLSAEARAMLRLLAWLAPDPVPAELLLGEAAVEPFAHAAALLMPTGETPAGAEEALADLVGYSMAQWDTKGAGQRFSVHRMVQQVSRSRIPESERRFWVGQALHLVDAYAPSEPDDVRSWGIWEPLSPHAVAVVERADAEGIKDPTSRIMNDLGLLFHAKCLYGEAEPLMRRALQIDEPSHGPDHPEVAVDLNNLAQLLQATNRLGEAEPLMRRHVEIFRRFGESTGHEHPHMRAAIGNYRLLLEQIGLSAGEIVARFKEIGIDIPS